jgi:hypothetical protein
MELPAFQTSAMRVEYSCKGSSKQPDTPSSRRTVRMCRLFGCSGAVDGRPTSEDNFPNCGDVFFRISSTILRIGRNV